MHVSLQGLLCPGTQLALRGNVTGAGESRGLMEPPLTTWAGRGRASPRCSPGSGASSGTGSGFPSTLLSSAQSEPESVPKEMKVPVSARGPRGPPLWDLESPIPAVLSWDPCCPGGVPALSGIQAWVFRAAVPTRCCISHLRGKTQPSGGYCV